jgi:NADPH-dependent 2,4-dienoyl-CoA reductase/sulfur reductase-like enzyme
MLCREDMRRGSIFAEPRRISCSVAERAGEENRSVFERKAHMKVAVVGSGAWGTALAIRLCKNGHDVTMWTFEKDLIPQMIATHRNPRCLMQFCRRK